MWNFLKADLQELVAVVKEDAASLGIPVVEGNVDDENNRIKNENSHDDVDVIKLYNRTDIGINNTPKTPAQEEAERRMTIPETFTVPLLPRKFTNCTDKNDTDDRNNTKLQNEILDSEPKVDESPLLENNIVSESTNENTGDDGEDVKVVVDEDFNVDKEIGRAHV